MGTDSTTRVVDARRAEERMSEPFLELILRVLFGGRVVGAGAAIAVGQTLPGVPESERGTLITLAIAMIVYSVLSYALVHRLTHFAKKLFISSLGDAVLAMSFYVALPTVRPVVLLGTMFLGTAYAVIGGLAIELPFVVIVTASFAEIEAADTRPTPGITAFTLGMFAVIMVLQASLLEAFVRERRHWRQDVADLAGSVEEMAETAFTDSLTSTANRHGLDEFLTRLADRPSGRPVRPASVLMIDVDRLKRINDDMGHLVGDQVLAIAAECIRQQLRPEDLVARWGGDEFIVILPGVDEQIAQRIGARIVEALDHSPVLLQSGTEFTATVSIGIASTDTEEFEKAIDEADTALRNAKKTGRNAVLVAHDN